jgi:hypothetical protein
MAHSSCRGQALIELLIVLALLIFCIFVTLERVTSLRQHIQKSGSERPTTSIP